jgi:SAM-dependent methyltransferase
MKQAVKTMLMSLPGGIGLIEKLRFKTLQELFTHYYEENVWGDQESVSGSHSTIQYTENIRKEIPRLIAKLGVRRILDAPCGDYNWFRFVPRNKETTYIGGDIVEALVERNQKAFGNDSTSFRRLDITSDELPRADLWICRDCLFHFSDRNIWRAIQNFFRSDIRYLLTTTYPHSKENKNIPTGGFRFLNLELPPLSFPKPIASIDDWIEGYPVKKLALWERKELSDVLAPNKAMQRMAKCRR